MTPAPASTTVDAWLQWFDTYQRTSCQAFLCRRYHLDALDAEALMNTARLQVFLHWRTIDNPLAYFWRTLTHAAGQQGQRRTYERRQLVVYARQHRVHAHASARTRQQVTDLVERVAPRQRRLLEWCVQGYDDVQIARWLTTTPQAVRVQRHRLIRALQGQNCPSGRYRYVRRRGGQ